MGLLQGKVAIITGGSRGIGESIVRKFAEQGANVAFTYQYSVDKAIELEKELASIGYKIKAFQSDASSFSDSEELVKKIMDEFGTVDILVNNAGITKDNLLLRMSEQQWDSVMEVNLKSIFNLTKHILRPMLKKRQGSIINISSVVGVFGNAGQSNYAASKAGIIGFTKSIAKELGSRNIRCNAIAPGFIETDMTSELDDKVRQSYIDSIPMKRLGRGDEVASACVFLGSDLSSYVTGQVLSVCGALNT